MREGLLPDPVNRYSGINTQFDYMTLTSVRRRSHKNLYRLAYSIIFGLCIACILVILSPPLDHSSWITLQNNAIDFLVQCETNDCSGLLLPFLVYLLDLGKNLNGVFILWVAVNTALSTHLIYQLIPNIRCLRHVFSISSLCFALVTFSAIASPVFLGALPCTLSVLLAMALLSQGRDNWHYLIIASTLINLAMSLLLLLPILCFLMLNENAKKARRTMIQIIKSLILGIVIIVIYLLLIGYNFLEWEVAVKHKPTHNNLILSIAAFGLSYVISLTALIKIHDKKIA
jgi:hypothetical protein